MFGKPFVCALAYLVTTTALGCGTGDGVDDSASEGGNAGTSEGGNGGDESGGNAGQEQGGNAAGSSAGAGGTAKGGSGGTGGANVGGTTAGIGGTVAGMGGTAAGSGGTAGLNPYNLPTNRPLLIQPLGDSITEGKGTEQEASYRRPLWKKLKAAGYNVDFVGSRNVQLGNAPPFFKDYDPDHEGHYGWRLSEIIKPENIEAWLKLYTPDVALVHLGTNDQGGGSGAQILANTETLVKKLRADNPAIVILLAQLILPGSAGQSFNSMLPALAQKLTTTTSPILVVNQQQGFTSADTIDGLHPNPMGQEKMATKWFASLMTFLPKP